MTFARLLVEIRRRAASIPEDVPRPVALEQAVREALDGFPANANVARHILAALVGIREGENFDPAILDELAPETVLRLDLIAGAMIDQGRGDEALRAIRASLIRPVR